MGDLLGLAGIVRVPTDEVQIVHSGGVELLLLLLLLPIFLPLPVSLPFLPVVPGGGPLPLAKSLQEGVDEPLKVLFPAELVKMPDDSNAKLRITKDDHMAGEYVVCSTTKHLASGHDQVEKI